MFFFKLYLIGLLIGAINKVKRNKCPSAMMGDCLTKKINGYEKNKRKNELPQLQQRNRR